MSLPTTVHDGAGIAPVSTWGQHLWQCQLQMSSAHFVSATLFAGLLEQFCVQLQTGGSTTWELAAPLQLAGGIGALLSWA